LLALLKVRRSVGAPPKKRSGRVANPLIQLGLEFLPLVAFFVANRRLGIFGATAVFIAATFVAVAACWLLLRRVSPILLFNAALVAVFGGLTLVLHDSVFIKVKPTIDYAMFAGVLAFGLRSDRLFLRNALGMAFPDLGERAWRVLTCNWAIFFAVMAVANELVWRTASTDIWVIYRVWVPTGATLSCAILHVPYLLRADNTPVDPYDRRSR
jgi:intracellular septation protein